MATSADKFHNIDLTELKENIDAQRAIALEAQRDQAQADLEARYGERLGVGGVLSPVTARELASIASEESMRALRGLDTVRFVRGANMPMNGLHPQINELPDQGMSLS